MDGSVAPEIIEDYIRKLDNKDFNIGIEAQDALYSMGADVILSLLPFFFYAGKNRAEHLGELLDRIRQNETHYGKQSGRLQQVITSLIEILKTSTDEKLVYGAITVLGQLHSEGAIEPILSVISNTANTVHLKDASRAALYNISLHYLSLFLDILRDKNRSENVRVHIALLLGEFADKENLFWLKYNQPPNVDVMKEIKKALGSVLIEGKIGLYHIAVLMLRKIDDFENDDSETFG